MSERVDNVPLATATNDRGIVRGSATTWGTTATLLVGATDEQIARAGKATSADFMCVAIGQRYGYNQAWVPPTRIRYIGFSSDVVLDFSFAQFVTNKVYVTLVGLLVGLEVIVPPGVSVYLDGHGVLVENDNDTHGGIPGIEEMVEIHLGGFAVGGEIKCHLNSNFPPVREIENRPIAAVLENSPVAETADSKTFSTKDSSRINTDHTEKYGGGHHGVSGSDGSSDDGGDGGGD